MGDGILTEYSECQLNVLLIDNGLYLLAFKGDLLRRLEGIYIHSQWVEDNNN